jgi:hypothetical protein
VTDDLCHEVRYLYLYATLNEKSFAVAAYTHVRLILAYLGQGDGNHLYLFSLGGRLCCLGLGFVSHCCFLLKIVEEERSCLPLLPC